MADINGGQIIVRQLVAAGIDTIFGVLGGPMIQVYPAAAEAGIKAVSCRHEESACFMASAWGYINRKPGVMVAASGPGMTNTVTSLHVATASSMPLVVLGGSAHGPTRGIGGFQEADQVSFAHPGCKWALQVDSVDRIPELVHLALGKAMNGRPGAVYLDFPGDFVAKRVPEETVRLRSQAPEIYAPHPDPAALDKVADLLAEAERPLILVGKGAAWSDAGPALERLVDLGFPYVTSPMGRGVIPDDNPNYMNGCRSAALAAADAILLLGGRFNWIFNFGRPPRYAEGVRIAQVDVCAEEMYSSANVELGIVGDAAVAAHELANRLTDRECRCADTGWLSGLTKKRAQNAARIADRVASDQIPIDPHRAIREVARALDRDASIAVDGEVTMGIARVLLPSYVTRSRLNAGPTGCIGTGIPYAIGAKLARPEAQSLALVGDYAFGTAGMEIETAARVGANVVIVVCNNEGIGGRSLQETAFPKGYHGTASLLPANYEKMAEMVDGHAERVEEPGEIAPALNRALTSERPAIVHIRVDPFARRVGGGAYIR